MYVIVILQNKVEFTFGFSNKAVASDPSVSKDLKHHDDVNDRYELSPSFSLHFSCERMCKGEQVS